MKNRLFAGFTLVEVLIALTVLGILVALTTPAVIKNYQKQTLLLGLKKAYTDFEQNLSMMQTENYRKKGLYNSRLNMTVDKTISNTAGDYLKEYYKYNKDCGTTAQPCFAAKYYSISGSEAAFSCSTGYSILTTGGYAICLIPASIREILNPKYNPYNINSKQYITVKEPATVYIDVNGPENPNTAGRDLFAFEVQNDFSIKEDNNTQCTTSATGRGCFKDIVDNNWKMEY